MLAVSMHRHSRLVAERLSHSFLNQSHKDSVVGAIAAWYALRRGRSNGQKLGGFVITLGYNDYIHSVYRVWARV